MTLARMGIMENRLTTSAFESGIESMETPMQSAERVVSIMDFDSSGMITCVTTKPLAGGLGTVRDSMSMRSITMDGWRELNGKQ
jgi:hypothetical protein